jgi:hypothetical protein
MPRANTDAMRAHRAGIGRHVLTGVHAILVVDGTGWHRARNLVVPANLIRPTRPPRRPALNPVETIRPFRRPNRLANRVFDSADAIVDTCCDT